MSFFMNNWNNHQTARMQMDNAATDMNLRETDPERYRENRDGPLLGPLVILAVIVVLLALVILSITPKESMPSEEIQLAATCSTTQKTECFNTNCLLLDT